MAGSICDSASCIDNFSSLKRKLEDCYSGGAERNGTEPELATPTGSARVGMKPVAMPVTAPPIIQNTPTGKLYAPNQGPKTNQTQ